MDLYISLLKYQYRALTLSMAIEIFPRQSKWTLNSKYQSCSFSNFQLYKLRIKSCRACVSKKVARQTYNCQFCNLEISKEQKNTTFTFKDSFNHIWYLSFPLHRQDFLIQNCTPINIEQFQTKQFYRDVICHFHH